MTEQIKGLSEEQLLLALLAIAAILLVGRGTAEIARRLRQPEVLGELIGGFLLGPSVLGALLPSFYRGLFVQEGVGLALSTISWVGAILLLLIAGLEADLKILRKLAKPGTLAASFAILPSIAAGVVFAHFQLDTSLTGSFFLGLVLSVTAVSVVAKILIERDSLRRGYAQVILAAGIASEVLVWLLISLVASLQKGHSVFTGVRTVVYAVAFFAVMMTLGRRFTFWAMRRMADLTHVVNGQLSLVLVLTFLSAGITEALGLHALLGAFVFGVLLNESPRATTQLKESLQTLTVGLFAPVFFVLAGMRVDIFQLRHIAALGTVLLLFAFASVVKAGLGSVGARLGGLNWWESLLVGTGVNLKGGSDVIVAILGVALGLSSIRIYTMYAVVAILTVLVSPPILAWLEKKVRPSHEEMERLNREEARSRAYLSDIERVLVPMSPELLPSISTHIVRNLAQGKQLEGEIFDITQLVLPGTDGQHASTAVSGGPSEEVTQAEENLTKANALDKIELSKVDLSGKRMKGNDALSTILNASKDHNLVAIGAKVSEDGDLLSFGELQDQVIDRAPSDVLVVMGDEAKLNAPIRRILVPVNGLEFTMSAADIAGYLAKCHQAELVLLTVVRAGLGPLQWRAGEHRRLLESGYRILQETKFRISRLGVQPTERVKVGQDPAEEIVTELKRQPYELLVLGAIERSGQDKQLVLSRTIEVVAKKAKVPTLLLVTHQ